MSTVLAAFDTTLQTTHAWLHELIGIMGWQHDTQRAYVGLRAVLHALRDRLTVDDTAALAVQLPMLVRGFYFEGWQPHGKPRRLRRKAAFLARVREHFPPDADLDAEPLTRGVCQLLRQHLPAGEIEKVKAVMPDELQSVWGDAAPAREDETSGAAGGSKERVDVTDAMSEDAHVDPDLGEGHAGYEESEDSEAVPAEHGAGTRS